jgi:hypothetical protein
MVEVRRGHLADAAQIAAFVNAAHNNGTGDSVYRQEVTRAHVVERFSQVGFMLAERGDEMVGLLGWQIENLVVRVTDYLVAVPDEEALSVAQSLVDNMEAEACELRAEAALLFLPPRPSPELLAFWERLGYRAEHLDALGKACREAITEWGSESERVMVKALCTDPVSRPL